MPAKISTKKLSFFDFTELYALTWQTWKQFFSKYLYFLSPFFLLGIVHIFVSWKYFTGKEGGMVFLLDLAYLFFLAIIQDIIGRSLFRDRKKKLTFSNLFKEARHHFWGYCLESLATFFLLAGGFLLFIIPGISFAMWFDYYGWLRVYKKDSKRFYLGESWALVDGYVGKIFVFSRLIQLVYIFGVVIFSMWLGGYAQFAVGTVGGLIKSLIEFGILIFPGSFFFMMNGLIFERLQGVKSTIEPKKLTVPVIVSVVGWSIGWLLMGIMAVIIIILVKPPQQ